MNPELLSRSLSSTLHINIKLIYSQQPFSNAPNALQHQQNIPKYHENIAQRICKKKAYEPRSLSA